MTENLPIGPSARIAPIARVGGVPLQAPDEALPAPELRQRACTELLRQAAMHAGLLAADDPAPDHGVISDAAAQAIEALLERELRVPEPSDEASRRHFAAHPGRWAVGERVQLRHVLFAVTPGVDVNALRGRAEACLIDLRAPMARDADLRAPTARDGDLRVPTAQAGEPPGPQPDGPGTDRFAEVARSLSNCPSGADGGWLGWLRREDCAPEFAAEVFGRAEVGVLARLVHSRFGLHVVEVLAREAGTQPDFDSVREAVAQSLRQQGFATALRQILQLLAGQIEVDGVDLDRAATPLLQ